MNNEAFGVSPGKIDDLASSGLTNDFATISNNNIDGALASDRIQPRQLGTGVLRGTQRIVNTDGSYITLGVIPDTDGEFGIAFFDSDGNMIKKDTGATQTTYNNGVELLVTDSTGLLFSDSTDRRIKIGAAPDDNRVGIWQSEDNEDVIELLGGT